MQLPRPALSLWVGLALSVFAALTPGVAHARPMRSDAAHAARTASPSGSAMCVVRSLASFIAQGESTTTATVADIVEVGCDPTMYGSGSRVKITANELFSRCGGNLTWYVPHPFKEEAGRGISVTLDADGNATVALRAGPGCQAGESLITVHTEEEPFASFVTAFTVLPPVPTPPGVFVLPATQVEDAGSSGLAAIVQAEFVNGSEKPVRIASEELFQRCRAAPHLHWILMDGTNRENTPEVNGVKLDNDGNAFVIVIGDSSCAPGPSLIEADLEVKPFTTYTTEFNPEPPRPTLEPAFTIEKRQQIAGSSSGFTTSPLKGAHGQTVQYEILVHNSGSAPLKFSGFTDARCDAGTIAGGPGEAPVAPGASTTYTCSRLLTAPGRYLNEAGVTGTPEGGAPITHASNQVEVNVPREPAFTIEKRQQIAGSSSGFTTAPLSGTIGQTVDYEILVTNTGNVPLAFSGFTDIPCDTGTIAGGPGEAPVAPGASTTYTCKHLLTSTGTYLNEASVSGTPEGEAPITRTSNQVEVNVAQAAPAVLRGPGFTIEKLQVIHGSGSGFTVAPLESEVGHTVDYEIVVTNTGNVPLALSGFTDAHCDAGTIAGGPAGVLAPGSSTTYTCSHVLTSPGRYTNQAAVTGTPVIGTPEGEAPITHASNQVEVNVATVAVKEECITSRHVLRGASGPKRGTFTARLSAAGIKRITFYLDHRMLKTLTAAQARHGLFAIKINPRRLSYGAHRLWFRTSMFNRFCPRASAAAVFVRPRPAPPPFTG